MNLELKPLKVAMLACCTLMIGEVAVAKTPAQANKVLNLAFEAPDDGFDMVKTYNKSDGGSLEFFESSIQLPISSSKTEEILDRIQIIKR